MKKCLYYVLILQCCVSQMRTFFNALTILRIARYWKEKALNRTSRERARLEEERQRFIDDKKMKDERAELLFGAKLVPASFHAFCDE